MSKKISRSYSYYGKGCDNCTRECSINDLKNHNEIFYLASQFPNKVFSAEGQLLSKASEVKNNLLTNYQISINSKICCLSHCENFLDEIRNKCDDFRNKNSELSIKTEEKKKLFEQEKKDILNTYNNEINSLKNINEKQQSLLNSETEKEKLKRKEIDSLIESINNLTKEKDNITNININEIANDYINEEQPKIEIEYENRKKCIDEQNKIIITNLEYTEEEKQLENEYLTIINNIKNYSDQIPYFDNWINMYDLKKYIK